MYLLSSTSSTQNNQHFWNCDLRFLVCYFSIRCTSSFWTILFNLLLGYSLWLCCFSACCWLCFWLYFSVYQCADLLWFLFLCVVVYVTKVWWMCVSLKTLTSLQKSEHNVELIPFFIVCCKKTERKYKFFPEKEKPNSKFQPFHTADLFSYFFSYSTNKYTFHWFHITTQLYIRSWSRFTRPASLPVARADWSYQAPSSEFVSSPPGPSSARSHALPDRDPNRRRPSPP